MVKNSALLLLASLVVAASATASLDEALHLRALYRGASGGAHAGGFSSGGSHSGGKGGKCTTVCVIAVSVSVGGVIIIGIACGMYCSSQLAKVCACFAPLLLCSLVVTA